MALIAQDVGVCVKVGSGGEVEIGKISSGKTLYYCTSVSRVVWPSWAKSAVVESVALHHRCHYKPKKKAFSATSLSCVGRSIVNSTLVSYVYSIHLLVVSMLCCTEPD